MKQQHGSGARERQGTAGASISGRGAHGISIVEQTGEGIRVCDGHAFDPHRFQEFDFSPAFRERMMRAPLPLLDLRQLHDDKLAQQSALHAGANDLTQPASGSSPEMQGATAAGGEAAPASAGLRLLLAHGNLRKVTGSALAGVAAKKWKSLLFGSLLVTFGIITG